MSVLRAVVRVTPPRIAFDEVAPVLLLPGHTVRAAARQDDRRGLARLHRLAADDPRAVRIARGLVVSGQVQRWPSPG